MRENAYHGIQAFDYYALKTIQKWPEINLGMSGMPDLAFPFVLLFMNNY
jgi:hypothetical protein